MQNSPLKAQFEPASVAPVEETVDEPILLLLLTPANSGSTAIADFVAQVDAIDGLNRRYEGQWGLQKTMTQDRWRRNKQIDFELVKKSWLKKFHELRSRNPKLKFILEKSPPNMLRYKEIATLFGEARIVVNIRNPYANIASVVFRYRNFDKVGRRKRVEILRKETKSWLIRARILRKIVRKEKYQMLSYEQFCENPHIIFQMFSLNEYITNVDSNYMVKVKDYRKGVISNMNEEQIKKFSNDEIDVISGILSKRAKLVEFFGYELRPSVPKLAMAGEDDQGSGKGDHVMRRVRRRRVTPL